MAGGDRRREAWAERAQNRWVWAGFAMPGIVWLVLLFVVPFYVVLAIAGGQLNAIFESPVPVWNPLHWTGANFTAVFHDLVGQAAVRRADLRAAPSSTWPSPRCCPCSSPTRPPTSSPGAPAGARCSSWRCSSPRSGSAT